jgi:TRAP-type C4-dicarboxylate transport system permease small subunit
VKVINSISQALNVVAIGILVAMMLLTVADVGMRYALNKPIVGSVELTKFMLVCLVCFGLAWCTVQGRHVKVELIMSRFSPRVQAICDSINYLVGLGFYGLIAWQSYSESFRVWEMNFVSGSLRVPFFPFYWVLAFGCAVLCLAIVTQMIQSVARVVKK